MIVIVDYGLGNIGSISNMLNRLHIKNKISNNVDDIKNSKALILPGVGSFKNGMSNLKNLNLIDSLKKQVIINKKPILGICLGAQLLTSSSTEGGYSKGLNFFK